MITKLRTSTRALIPFLSMEWICSSTHLPRTKSSSRNPLCLLLYNSLLNRRFFFSSLDKSMSKDWVVFETHLYWGLKRLEQRSSSPSDINCIANIKKKQKKGKKEQILQEKEKKRWQVERGLPEKGFKGSRWRSRRNRAAIGYCGGSENTVDVNHCSS